MAKENKRLAKSLQARGIRKKIADDIASAIGGGGKKRSRKSISDLKSAVSEINERLRGGSEQRSAAAKKGARTRRRNAEKRSEAAKRGARKRARA